MSAPLLDLRIWSAPPRVYAVPSHVSLPPGELLLQSGLHRAWVDPLALAPYAISAELARELVLGQVLSALAQLQGRTREGGVVGTVRCVLEALGAAQTQGDRQTLPEVLVDAVHRFSEAARGPAPQAGRARSELEQALCRARPLLVERLTRAAARLRRESPRKRLQPGPPCPLREPPLGSVADDRVPAEARGHRPESRDDWILPLHPESFLGRRPD